MRIGKFKPNTQYVCIGYFDNGWEGEWKIGKTYVSNDTGFHIQSENHMDDPYFGGYCAKFMEKYIFDAPLVKAIYGELDG